MNNEMMPNIVNSQKVLVPMERQYIQEYKLQSMYIQKKSYKTPTIFSRITTLSPIAALDIQSREAQRQKTKPARSQICKAAISNQINLLPKSYITSLIDTTKYDYTRFINIPQGGRRCL